MDLINSVTFKDLKAPLFIAWQINSECNLGCLHCCEEAGHPMPDQMHKDQIFNFLRQIIELKIPYVALSGGEPLLHPQFFEICEFLRQFNISLKVETNGEFIDRNLAKIFARLKFRSVQISLDGATKDTHERLRLRGDWNKTVSACKALIEEKVNTEIVFVPTKFNIHEIGELIDLAYSLGVWGVYTGKIMRIGRAAKNWDILCPSDEEYDVFFGVLNKKIAQYDGRMKVYYYPYDVIEELKYRLRYPSASLLVIPNGKVKLIGPLPFICGDLRKHSLIQVWENYKQAWSNPKVVEFAKKVIEEPWLVSEANDWIELYH
ncbi:MAG: radical SAM protein [Candidatus Omnitrophota bacterium]